METAADKLSALTWRILARNRNHDNDDPTMIRHLHDLAALSDYIGNDFEVFSSAARTAIARDKERRRGGETIQHLSDKLRLEQTVEILKTDHSYRHEYEEFVLAMSYADDDEKLSFDEAISRLEKLINRYLRS